MFGYPYKFQNWARNLVPFCHLYSEPQEIDRLLDGCYLASADLAEISARRSHNFST